MLAFEKDFYTKLDQKFFFERNPKIAVAVSGGPDSIALIFLLKKWIKLKKGKLIGLIVDHQIRERSSSEALFVSNFLNKNNIKNVILKVTKKNIMKGKMHQARNNRFQLLINYTKKNNIFHLFLGHHLDDNIETFMLRKIAGSNFEGLNSIKSKSIMNEINIFRPLIYFSKKNILQYLDYKKIFYIDDPSNHNMNYSRVVVRNFFKEYPRHYHSIKSEFNLIKNHYSEYQKMIYEIFILISLKILKNKIIFDYKKFNTLDLEIQTKIIEITNKFLNVKKPYLRYSKIVQYINEEKKNPKKIRNLGSLKIKKDPNTILFSFSLK